MAASFIDLLGSPDIQMVYSSVLKMRKAGTGILEIEYRRHGVVSRTLSAACTFLRKARDVREAVTRLSRIFFIKPLHAQEHSTLQAFQAFKLQLQPPKLCL